MKNYRRIHKKFSLCGLNCILCPMHNMDNGCPGCGGGEGHQSCSKIKCAIEKNIGEFCFECGQYPCDKYTGASEKDSFITYRNMFEDTEYAKENGIDKYEIILDEKADILRKLLENYNDGRKKTLFCTAVNLMDINDIKDAFKYISSVSSSQMTQKEKSAYAADTIKKKASERGISLKLRK